MWIYEGHEINDELKESLNSIYTDILDVAAASELNVSSIISYVLLAHESNLMYEISKCRKDRKENSSKKSIEDSINKYTI